MILAYDGSDLAASAIEQASVELIPGREALVVCVWQPAHVGFVPVDNRKLRTAAANEVRAAAEETAAKGSELARRTGFDARPRPVAAAPIWKGLIEVAQDHRCGLIVVGSHQRHGLLAHLAGSVAAATVSHFEHSVLVVRRPEQLR